MVKRKDEIGGLSFRRDRNKVRLVVKEIAESLVCGFMIVGMFTAIFVFGAEVETDQIAPETEQETGMRWYADNSDHYYTNYEDYLQYKAERQQYLDEQAEEDRLLIEAHDRFMEQMESENPSGELFREIEPWNYSEEDLAEEILCDEYEYLAILVMAEAGNQDLTGKRMVADVVLNRVDDPDFPDTITKVIEQPGQFATYTNGILEYTVPSDECFEAVRMEIETRGWPGLLYFSSESFLPYGTPWKKVGDHYFSTK